MVIWYDFFENTFVINVYEANPTLFFTDFETKLIVNYEEKKSCCRSLLSFLTFPKTINHNLNIFWFKIFVAVF